MSNLNAQIDDTASLITLGPALVSKGMYRIQKSTITNATQFTSVKYFLYKGSSYLPMINLNLELISLIINACRITAIAKYINVYAPE